MRTVIAGFACSRLLGVAPALAQNYPSKPIRIIIAQAPGSATDVISRVVGNRLSEALGQPIVIEARPGAGGAVGTEAAARSAPDGYTLFMANNSTHGSNPALYPKLPYDAVNDFAPISLVASVPYVLVVDPALPVKSVQELIALAKSRPGQDELRLGGQRQHAPVLRRAAEVDARASTSCTSRTRARRPGIAGAARRRGVADVRQPHRHRLADPQRQGQAARRDRRQAREPAARGADAWPRRGCRISRSARGSACSRPPERRRRSSRG